MLRSSKLHCTNVKNHPVLRIWVTLSASHREVSCLWTIEWRRNGENEVLSGVVSSNDTVEDIRAILMEGKLFLQQRCEFSTLELLCEHAR